MSIYITQKVWSHGPRDKTLKLVLLALSDHANDAGFAFPSTKLLAEKCCLRSRSIISAINVLERNSWLKRIKKGRKTSYQIDLSKLGTGEFTSPIKGEGSSPITPIGEIRRTEQVKSTAAIGEIHCKPPAPPYRSNRQEPSYEPEPEVLEEALSLIATAQSDLRQEAARRGIAKAIVEELQMGARLEDLCEILPDRWRQFTTARDQGKFEIRGWGAENFFAGGHWRDEQSWPWKPEFRPEQPPRYVDLTTVYSGPEYQQRTGAA